MSADTILAIALYTVSWGIMGTMIIWAAVGG